MFSGKIFRSRWSALIWAGGILWTAYDVASAAPHKSQAPSNASAAADAQTDSTGSIIDNADLAVLVNEMRN